MNVFGSRAVCVESSYPRGFLPARWRNIILPDGAVELIINLGEPKKLCAQDNTAKHTTFRHSWISGERTAPIVIDEIGYVHLGGVRLRVGGAWRFLGIPLRVFTDQVIELDAILGNEIRQLRDQLGEASDDDARFDLSELWLAQRARARAADTLGQLRLAHDLRDAANQCARRSRFTSAFSCSQTKSSHALHLLS